MLKQMHRQLRLLWPFLLLFALVRAYGADWVSYFENRAGVKFSIDTQSLTSLKDGNIRAWQKQEFKEEDPALGKGFLWLLEANCQEHKYIYRTITPIKATSGNLKMVPTMIESYGGWNYFAPNDLDEATYAAWCRSRKNKK